MELFTTDAVGSIIIGFVLLVFGGDILVRGAVKAASAIGVSPLLIGIVLVGFGTSAPEMAVSVQAAATGAPGIAVGNFVGSSIANILLILGLSSMVMPVAVESRALYRDGAVVVLSALVFAAVAAFLPLDRYVGSIFLLWLATYLFYAWRQERVGGGDSTSAMQKAEAHAQLRKMNVGSRWIATVRSGMPFAAALVLACIGLGLLIIGGQVLVDGSVRFARDIGVDEAVIGLTVVAVGTSMPELVTSLVAAFRSQPAVAVGNILGSNIYNVLAVGGLTGFLAPTVVPERIVTFDNAVMVVASLVLVVFARSGLRVSRLEGLILFAGYCAYIYVLWPMPNVS